MSIQHIAPISGLEIMRMVADGRIQNPTMADTMHMILAQAESGRVVFKATAGGEHLNPMGGVHGGFAATVLDSATGAAVHTMLQEGDGYGTIDLNVKMLKPVPVGRELTAEGRVLSLSRRLGVAEASLKDDAGTIYALATATCMILRRNAA